MDPDPHGSASFGNPNTDPDRHLRDKHGPDPDQFADDKSKYMKYERLWALFQGFELLFGR